MHVAVIDLGKTNSKVALVDTDSATEIHVVTQAAAVSTQSPYPSLDHEGIFAFILSALNTLTSTHTIDALTVTTHGATAALMDAQGELVLPVLDYEYNGPDTTRDAYAAIRPDFHETGSPTLPGGLNIGAQLYWLESTFPEHFARTLSILTWPQYWIRRLSGQSHNDVTSLGCHTDLYNPWDQRYSSLVDRMNWRNLMPPTQCSGTLSGPVLPAVAAATGLSPRTPVHTGIHDSNASLVPHLLSNREALTVVSTGTWFIAMAVGCNPVNLDETRDTLLNVNAFGQVVPSARFMGGREHELLKGSTDTCDTAMQLLLANVEQAPILLPAVVPGTGPFPNASTRWIGLPENEHHRDCAIALYLALMTDVCMTLVGSEGPVYIEGPLAHHRHYAGMLHAVSNRPVLISGAQTGTSVGAAMLISPPRTEPSYEPVSIDAQRRDRLQRYATRWQRAVTDHAR